MLGQPVYFLTPEVVGVQPHRRAQGRRHRDRSRAARHARCCARRRSSGSLSSSSARRGVASGRRSRDHREHGAGIWRDDGLLRRGRRDGRRTCAAPAAARNSARPLKTTTRRRASGAFRDKGEIDYTVDLELDLATVVPGVAGPKRPQDRIDLPELKKTFEALFEKPVAEGGYGKTAGDLVQRVPVHINGASPPAAEPEMPSTDTRHQRIPPKVCRRTRRKWSRIARRPTDRVFPRSGVPPGGCGDRPRLRAHRGDHELHEHEQSERDARRGSAREEGRRARTEGESRGEDFARARLARRHRLPRTRPASSPTSTSSASRPSATAARRASATAGPLHPALEEAIAKNDLVAASVLSRQPQLRGARASEHQGELPHVAAARRRLRARRPRGHRPEHRTARQGQGRQGRLSEGHLADAGGNPRRDGVARSSRKSSASSTPTSPSRIRSGTKSRPPSATSTSGTARAPTSRSRRSSRLRDGARPYHRNQRRAPARHLRRLRDDRSHLPRRRDQEDLARLANTSSSTASPARTSTATARAAATTAS